MSDIINKTVFEFCKKANSVMDEDYVNIEIETLYLYICNVIKDSAKTARALKDEKYLASIDLILDKIKEYRANIKKNKYMLFSEYIGMVGKLYEKRISLRQNGLGDEGLKGMYDDM